MIDQFEGLDMTDPAEKELDLLHGILAATCEANDDLRDYEIHEYNDYGNQYAVSVTMYVSKRG